MAGLMFDRPFTPSELRSLMQGTPVTPSQIKSGATPANFSQAPTRGLVDYDALRNLRNAPKQPVSTTTTAIPKQPVGVGTQLANGLTKIAASPVSRVAGGVGMMMYPSPLGEGTLDSLEAKQAMAANNANKVIGFEGDVPIIQGPQGQVYNNKETIQKQMQSVKAPVSAPLNQVGVTPPDPTKKLGGTDINGVLSYLGDGAALKDMRERSQVAQEAGPLISNGYRSLNNPEVNNAISGKPPGYDENILMKERFGTPKEYTAAVQSNENVTRFGQQMGLEQSFGARGYIPNDATKAGMEHGGAITEYAVPGKGSATFYGQRQSGGTLSVVGGRTPEEQAAIDARVKTIDSQTAAMRDIRNANRKAQGLPTVEQEAQTNAIRAMMSQLAPSPDMSALQEERAALIQKLKDAPNDYGKGKGRQRRAAIEALQIGLAQNDSATRALQQSHGVQAGIASNLLGSENEMASKSAANEFAALKYAAERGDKQAEQKLNDLKAYMEIMDKGQGRALEAQRNAIMANRPASGGSNEMPGVYKSMDENGREIFNTELFEQWNNIQPLGDGKSAKQGQIYKSGSGTYGMIDPKTGQYVDGLSYQQIHNMR